MNTLPKVIRIHHEHFRLLKQGMEVLLPFEVNLATGEQVIINSFTKSGEGTNEAQAEVIDRPIDKDYGTAFRINSIFTPKKISGRRWPRECVIVTMERDGSIH